MTGRAANLLTPVEHELRRRKRRRRLLLAAALSLLVLGGGAYVRSVADRAVAYASEEDHFKYGSIGSDRFPKGLPAAVIAVLPQVFPEYLPDGAPHDYTAFGLLTEPGHAWPIGLSQRTQVIVLVGPNCAFCHVGTVRTSPGAEPAVYLGAPGHTIDLEGFFRFLFTVAEDPRFTPESLMLETSGK